VATTIEIHVPDELRRRMDEASGEDWSQVARQAIERHLERLVPLATAPLHPNAAYDQGYTWARDRAVSRDLRAMVSAPSYRTAVDIVRGTKGFSQRDEFGDCAYPSDEMWEAFSMAPPRDTTRAAIRAEVSGPARLRRASELRAGFLQNRSRRRRSWNRSRTS
jgi:hypothetical protein